MNILSYNFITKNDLCTFAICQHISVILCEWMLVDLLGIIRDSKNLFMFSTPFLETNKLDTVNLV